MNQLSFSKDEMGVSKNNGTPKSSILIGFSIINHPFLGTHIFGSTQMVPRSFVIRTLSFDETERNLHVT